MNLEKNLQKKNGKPDAARRRILRSNALNIDYVNGVFDLEGNRFDGYYEFTYEGGSNEYILEDEDYRYVWDNLIAEHRPFMEWMESHNSTEKDLMSLHCELGDYGNVDIDCTFSFYSEEKALNNK